MINDYISACEACGGVVTTLPDGVMLIPDDSSVLLTYQNLPLVLYKLNGVVIMYNDVDCATVQYKNRLNKYTPSCVNVVQKDFALWIEHEGETIEFGETYTFTHIRR